MDLILPLKRNLEHLHFLLDINQEVFLKELIEVLGSKINKTCSFLIVLKSEIFFKTKSILLDDNKKLTMLFLKSLLLINNLIDISISLAK